MEGETLFFQWEYSTKPEEEAEVEQLQVEEQTKSRESSEESTQSIPQTPLEVVLPALPSPSLSRSTSVTHHRSSTGMTTTGLDLSFPQRYQSRFGPSASIDSQIPPPSPTSRLASDRTMNTGGLDSDVGLEEEIYKTRQARLQRTSLRSQTSPPTSITSRDNASARENIMALAANAPARPSPEGSAPSLASFMGGGARPPRLHRVGTGPTEQERDETEKLEKEMAARKARFPKSGGEEEPKAGVSLADLMGGRVGGATSQAPVAKRWTPSSPTKASSAPPSLPVQTDTNPSRPSPISRTTSDRSNVSLTASEPPLTSTSPRPQSLAAMLGSRAAGPRLNQPLAQAPVEEGPPHARPQSSSSGAGVAMPGMVATGLVRKRKESLTSMGMDTTPSSPAVVEAKIITRAPPPTAVESLPPPAATTTKAVEVEAKIISRSPPSSIPNLASRSPIKLQQNLNPEAIAPKMAPTASLTRLQSSNIVADRLKWSEEKEGSVGSKEAEASPAKTSAAVKRRSVLERWGRDEPNVASALSSAPSSPAKQLTTEEKSLTGIRGGEFSKGLGALPTSAGPALVHFNRAKPPRSTPRAAAEQAPISVPAPDAFTISPSSSTLDIPSATVDSSSRFDSTLKDSESWTDTPLSDEPTSNARGWSGPPITVKPTTNRQTSWTTRKEIPQPKYSPGVALPGMVPAKKTSEDPTMSRLIASQYETTRGVQDIDTSSRYKEPERPTAMQVASSFSQAQPSTSIPFPSATNPWVASTTKDLAVPFPTSSSRPSTPPTATRARPTSISISRLAKVELEDGPRSPGGSLVRDKIAAWGSASPSKSLSRAASRSTSIDMTYKPSLYEANLGLKRKSSTPYLSGSATSSSGVFSLDLSSDVPIELDYGGVLYETETIVAVKRSHGSATEIYVWVGSTSKYDLENGGAFQSLHKQYRIEPTVVRQGSEPLELLTGLVAPLVIRKGRRSVYDKQQERLYRVEARVETITPSGGGLVLDERHLAAESLCSGFSNVIACNGDVYVWRGKGSLPTERAAAEAYAREVAEGRPVTIVEEGKEPSHFWFPLGNTQKYASANHWRFRPLVAHRHPTTLYRVDSSSSSPTRQNFSDPPSPSSITLIDAGLEKIVLVPQGATDRKAEIAIALETASQTSLRWKSRGLPFRPPTHVLVFPTLLPLDYLHISGCADLARLNAGVNPTKMQIYDVSEARKELVL